MHFGVFFFLISAIVFFSSILKSIVQILTVFIHSFSKYTEHLYDHHLELFIG